MERVCLVGRVRAERLAEYRRRHEEARPELLAALREAGWGNYSLFLTADGLLVGYLETDDYQAALDRMAPDRGQLAVAGGNGTLLRGAGRPAARIGEIFHLD